MSQIETETEKELETVTEEKETESDEWNWRRKRVNWLVKKEFKIISHNHRITEPREVC